MNKIFKSKQIQAAFALIVLVLVSCNKIYEPVPGAVYDPGDATTTIAKKIAANSSYSIFTAALNRTGLYTVLDQPNANFTVFAPTDAAFTASGLSLTIVNAMPLADLTKALQHHIIPNEKITGAQIATTVPNVEKKSALDITTVAFVSTIPTTAIPIKMSIFPSSRATGKWLNNIPVTATDVFTGSNGVVHSVAAVVAPPTRVLLDTLSRDPDYAYFMAAVLRADSGLTSSSTSSLQYALGQPFANLTVFAPTNAAFQAVLYAQAYPLVYGQTYKAVYDAQIAGGADAATANAAATAYATANAPAATTSLVGSPTVFSNPALYGVLTAQAVKGIVVYHMMGQRYFSVNFGTTAANYPTLLNTAIPAHPGLSIAVTLSSNFGVGLSVKGVANATAATATATAAGVDRPAVNGDLFKINQVLLPQ